ncbi:MAG: Heat-inducible transcription repressor HrcA [Ktedonobacterales bacterium]|jgi:heat-inducible transcriptional repressor|nr:MAG: Heat-inducible transcription repressor HrcA [Ktedonobacterales bacterium]
MPKERRLSQRKEAILRALIEQYTQTGEPVPSKQLSDQLAAIYGAGYASATVRNELVALEDEGLIYQPHISAGRIPTDLGYRYFVERLMGESRLPLEEQRLIRHQFFQVQHQLDEWVRLTASVMARLLQSAAIVTPPRGLQPRLKHFALLALNEAVALLVLVLSDGTVRQERLLLDEPAAQDELSRVAEHFNDRFRGATADAVTAHASLEGEFYSTNERIVAESLARMLEQLDVFAPGAFYSEGISQLLRREEYAHADSDRIRRVVEVLERSQFLPTIAPQVMAAEGVQVIIGAENEPEILKDMSVVAARYGTPGQSSGMVGIVGPTRMQYGRAIAVVRYMTQMLDDLLTELHTPDEHDWEGKHG